MVIPVENVGRGRIVTAAAIMRKNPVIVRLKKEGPEAIIRKMREKNLFALPVVGADGKFLGEISLKDVVNLRKQGIKEIDSVIVSEVPSVLETTTVEDMLTLLPKIKQAIPVVSEDNVLLGVVSPSSIIIEMTGKDQNEIDKIIQNAIDL